MLKKHSQLCKRYILFTRITTQRFKNTPALLFFFSPSPSYCTSLSYLFFSKKVNVANPATAARSCFRFFSIIFVLTFYCAKKRYNEIHLPKSQRNSIKHSSPDTAGFAVRRAQNNIASCNYYLRLSRQSFNSQRSQYKDAVFFCNNKILYKNV